MADGDAASRNGFTKTSPSIVELRVHGVGGASPQELLGVPHVEQVAGGEDAGFFRPAAWLRGEESWTLEAYSWGGITSRARSRAIWLFLLPFALLNVAGWMYERQDDPRPRRVRLAVTAIRLEALVTTAIFTTLISILTIELVGYRCVAAEGCIAALVATPWRWWTTDPVDGIALGTATAALLMIAIALTTRAGRRGRADPVDLPDGDPARRVGVDNVELWGRPDVSRRLGIAHTAATLALISLFGVEAAGAVVELGSWATWIRVADGVIIIWSLLLVLPVGWISPLIRRATVAVASGVAVASVILIWRLPAPSTAPDGALISGGARGVFVVFLLLFLLRWIAYIWGRVWQAFLRLRRSLARRGEDQAAARARGLVPAPAFATGRLVMALRRWAAAQWNEGSTPILSLRAAVPVLGAGIAVAVGSGILLRVQGWLGTDYPTDLLDRVAVFGLGWIGLVVLTAVWVWFSHPGRTPEEIVATDMADVGGIDLQSDGWWLRKISSAESVARITDEVETLITVPAVLMLVGVVALAGDYADRFVDVVAGPAGWILSLLPLGLILAFNSLYRSRNFRRSLGIIWDVATFWPRWYHPWAPPPYGERAVPQLRRRLETLTEDGGAVVLSAHSQGTVVAAAAVAQLDAATGSRVAVITHGSPLARLYVRYFANVFSVDLFRSIAADLGGRRGVSWRNLYRRTDYIGGPVFGDSQDDGSGRRGAAYEDRLVRDPPDPRPKMRGDPRPHTLNHSDYYADPAYTATIEEYVGLFREMPDAAGRPRP